MILFRVDGNHDIGMGHIMRCLAIAEQAIERGYNCLFALSSDECINIIVNKRCKAVILDSKYNNPNTGELDSIIKLNQPFVVIVDSYFVTDEYMAELKVLCNASKCRLLYIDDLCTHPFCCDYLLNYNIYSSVDDYNNLYSGKFKPIFLLGPRYIPLRKEFQNIKSNNYSPSTNNVFVSTGGSDIEHFCVNLVEEAASHSNFVFHFVIGFMNTDKALIHNKSRLFSNIVIHNDVAEMYKLMNKCSVAISAAGSTLYELCAVGIPTITYIIANNQISAAKEFDKRGIITNCGDIRDIGREKLASLLVNNSLELINDKAKCMKISKTMQNNVNGFGVGSILDALNIIGNK